MDSIKLDDALAPLQPTKKPGRPPLPGGAHRIGVSLPSATYGGLVALVARGGRPLSEYVRDVLVAHVDALTGSDDELVDEDPDQLSIEFSAAVTDADRATMRAILDMIEREEG